MFIKTNRLINNCSIYFITLCVQNKIVAVAFTDICMKPSDEPIQLVFGKILILLCGHFLSYLEVI